MKIYVVSADSNGAYVDSGYISETVKLQSINWIAIFHEKDSAQAYVAYLNRTYTTRQIKGLIK